MRALKDYLISASYEIDWLERPEGHSWGLWRATIDRMLIYFFPDNSNFVRNENNTIVKDFTLYQNYPNPFNPSTTIKYELLESNFVSIKIFDALGKEISTLVNEEKQAGEYEVEFNVSNLAGGISAKGVYATGIYFYQLKVGKFIETKKMTLLK